MVDPSAPKRIAIIGGGAKAAAIAARASVLNRVLDRRIEVTVFEEIEIGANWSGSGGYTDGEAPLCTPAERDLGFPYNVGRHRGVNEILYAEFSWPAYLVSLGEAAFKDWVNRGRRPPSHGDFARYLAWAVAKSKAAVVKGRVSRLRPLKGGWRVSVTGGDTPTHGPFDGVVVTGPGPALSQIQRVGTSDRVVDGRAFWHDPDAFLERGRKYEEPLVIVGAGGTSAAIAARAVRHGAVSSVVIIGDQAALFARTESFFESQLFSEDELWKSLAPQTRRDFVDRLNRGVVWATISDTLSRSNKVGFRAGRGQRIETTLARMRDGSTIEELAVHFRRGTHLSGVIPAGLVVDASGFDSWWFMDLLPKGYRKRVDGKDDRARKARRRRVSDAMSEDLALFDKTPGPIHAPMLSQSVGPGFASLMVLGSMSERVLRRYTA